MWSKVKAPTSHGDPLKFRPQDHTNSINVHQPAQSRVNFCKAPLYLEENTTGTYTPYIAIPYLTSPPSHLSNFSRTLQRCRNPNAPRSSTSRKWRRRVRSCRKSYSMACGKLRTDTSTSSFSRSRICEIRISRMSGRNFQTAGTLFD
jgi:hypothetical protein